MDAARECFERALEIAGKQEAASLALRIAMSLVRLPMRHAAAREARTRLRSFVEGFDTKDLQDTKALLGEPKGS